MARNLIAGKKKKSIHIITALLLFCNVSLAQDSSGKASLPVGIEVLNGFTQKIYYSTGYNERARDIAVFMEQAGKYFQNEIGFTPKTNMYIPVSYTHLTLPTIRLV